MYHIIRDVLSRDFQKSNIMSFNSPKSFSSLEAELDHIKSMNSPENSIFHFSEDELFQLSNISTSTQCFDEEFDREYEEIINEQDSYCTCANCCKVINPLLQVRTSGIGDQEITPKMLYKTEEEAEIYVLRQLLFAFQGVSGKCFEKIKNRNSFTLTDELKSFPSLYQHALHLAELGSMYFSVHEWTESVPPVGAPLCVSALVTAIRSYLTKFHLLIAQLEAQLTSTVCTLSLMKFRSLTSHSMHQMRLLELIVSSCKYKSGGAVLSTLHELMQHGDPKVFHFLKPIFLKIAEVFYRLLGQWLCADKFYDPYSEFFITTHETGSKSTYFWSTNYYEIRTEMIPSFISIEQAKQVLEAGRNVALLKKILHCNAVPNNLENIDNTRNLDPYAKIGPAAWLRNGVMQVFVDRVLHEASLQLLQAILSKGKLEFHLNTLAGYFLFKQGCFSRELLRKVGHILNKPCSKIVIHELKTEFAHVILETSIGENARMDVMSFIQVELSQAADSSTSGWESFTLQYSINDDDPISLVITENAIYKYKLLFRELLRAKRIQWIFSDVLLSIKSLWRLLQSRKTSVLWDLHTVHLLVSDMNLLIQQAVYYLQYIQMETLWTKLHKAMSNAQTLDCLISAHNSFLDNALKALFIEKDNCGARCHLSNLYNLVICLQSLCSQLTSYSLRFVQYNNEEDMQHIIQIQQKFDKLKNSLDKWKNMFLSAVLDSRNQQFQDLIRHINN